MDFKKVLKGIACGIIYISSYFWTMVLTFLDIEISFIFVVLSVILSNIAVGILMASESHRYSLYKWLISLPAGFITFLIYREINFIYYWINKIHPGYGNLSGGAAFALCFYLFFYLLCFLIAIFVSVYNTSKNIDKLSSDKSRA